MALIRYSNTSAASFFEARGSSNDEGPPRCQSMMKNRVVGFYEKVTKVKADVAALPMIDLRHISTERFALGSLRSDDWQLGRPTASPVFSVLPRNLARFLPCCIALGW
jgi:hypothetical protein